MVEPSFSSFSLTPEAPLATGPSGWHYPHWDGVIYPRERPRGFHALDFLARRFDAVEIATSFENDIRPELARLWMAKVEANPQFQFTAKLHRRFTHERVLEAASVESFAAGLRELKRGKKLGALVMQFPWSFRFTRENRDYFIELRRAFHEFPMVAEMRHESWMSSEAVGTLIDYRVGFCNLDQPRHIKAMPPTAFLTSGVAYFRLHGKQRAWWWNEFEQGARPSANPLQGYTYSPAELAEWKDRVEQVRGLAERTFCVFTNDGGGQAVVNALQFGGLFAPARKGANQDRDEREFRLAVA
ncbi:MAG: DUF72 domain-containing protein [Acidobacteria bacterium]|nr:DUF72 domain-containing protein [Acidobacteriota bacterium]